MVSFAAPGEEITRPQQHDKLHLKQPKKLQKLKEPYIHRNVPDKYS